MLRLVLIILATTFLGQAAAPALASQKLAFVAGVDRYDNLGPQQQLQRAVNDARAVSAALASLGFDVISAENLGRAAFNSSWQKFLDRIAPGDTVAVYFSGHGVEVEGLNFLLPRDVPNISYGRQEQLKRESLSVAEFLLDLRKRKPQVTLIILDACRDHPLIPPELRSAAAGGGLARMDAPEGTFIMYSAGAGETALDRLPTNDPDNINSVYTRRLLPLLKTPGLPLHELARQLRREVSEVAAKVPHTQRPAYYDGLIGKVCLAGCEAIASARIVPSLTSETAQKCDGVETLVSNERRCLKPKDAFKDCPECPDMVLVPAGSFIMGSPKDEPARRNSEDQVPVTINKPFAVGRFAITRAEFAAFVAATSHKTNGGCNAFTGRVLPMWKLEADRNWRSPGFEQDDRHPVVCVNWYDAKAFVAWLSLRSGKTYRLLSEAEREYVARAGTTTPFGLGASISTAQANYNGRLSYFGESLSSGEFRQKTVPVDAFASTTWGLHNVHGNVWEWTEDCWNGSNVGNPGDGRARTAGGDCTSRVLRGGSWLTGPRLLRSASRDGDDPLLRYDHFGFRVARTID